MIEYTREITEYLLDNQNIFILVLTGEGLGFIGFVSRHPGVIWQILSFCVASAFGQFFIFMCVR